MNYISFILGEIKYGFIIIARYKLNFFAEIANTLLFLVFIMLGIKSFSGMTSDVIIESKIGDLIIGYFSYSVISSSIAIVAHNVREGAMSGTLEQTIIAPFGAYKIFLVRGIVSSTYSVIISILLVPLTMLITNRWFFINPMSVLLFAPPLVLCTLGIGFILGGMTLIFRRTASILGLTQFIVLSILVIPAPPFSINSIFPVAVQADLLQKMMKTFSGFVPLEYGFVWIHTLLWLVFGIIIFNICESVAKKRGLLSQY